MYASLFLLFLVMVLWILTYREGLDDGITPSNPINTTDTFTTDTVTTDSATSLQPSTIEDSTSMLEPISTTASPATAPPATTSTTTAPPATAPPAPGSSISACDSVNAQNQVDLKNLTTKVDTALQLSETIKKLEATLQDNTTRIDTIINTQLTALVSGKR